jgi:hypothetical protein
MGSTTDPKKFVADIKQMATITERRQSIIVGQGAQVTKEIIIAQAASAGVKPTSKLAKKRWGVRYKVQGTKALVAINGPFHLVERDTKAHPIGPRTRGRGSRKRAIAFGGIVRANAQHPGTKGKHIFADAKAKASIAAPKIMSKSVVSGWRDALK